MVKTWPRIITLSFRDTSLILQRKIWQQSRHGSRYGCHVSCVWHLMSKQLQCTDRTQKSYKCTDWHWCPLGIPYHRLGYLRVLSLWAWKELYSELRILKNMSSTCNVLKRKMLLAEVIWIKKKKDCSKSLIYLAPITKSRTCLALNIHWGSYVSDSSNISLLFIMNMYTCTFYYGSIY